MESREPSSSVSQLSFAEREAISRHCKEHPKAPYQDVARLFGVTPKVVYEVCTEYLESGRIYEERNDRT